MEDTQELLQNINEDLIKIEDSQTYEDQDQINLQQSLQDLSDIQNHLSQLIMQQDESIDKIESSIINTDNNIEIANQELEAASKYHFNYKPIIIGALLGGLAITPFGALINIKLGSLFTMTGGVMGGILGYKVQK